MSNFNLKLKKKTKNLVIGCFNCVKPQKRQKLTKILRSIAFLPNFFNLVIFFQI